MNFIVYNEFDKYKMNLWIILQTASHIFAHRYFVENLAARFAMIAQAGGAIFASFVMLGLLTSLAHRKCASAWF